MVMKQLKYGSSEFNLHNFSSRIILRSKMQLMIPWETNLVSMNLQHTLDQIAI
jgi:hypothetical protein